jgi:hypothetical protein
MRSLAAAKRLIGSVAFLSALVWASQAQAQLGVGTWNGRSAGRHVDRHALVFVGGAAIKAPLCVSGSRTEGWPNIGLRLQ